MKPALVLSGGGARGAYQVGVLKAISDLHCKQSHNPFSVISGTSAGAISAVALASSANNFRLSVKKVERIWTRMHVDQIYKAEAKDLIYGIARIVASTLNQGIGRHRPLSVLDNTPLRFMLENSIQFKNIQKRIDAGYLDAVAINATGYTSSENVTFFQGKTSFQKWRRGRHVGVPTLLSVKHLLASSAIPMVFPAEYVSREYFGDGALRQLAPISPVLRLGADRVLVIGVSGNPTHVPHHDAEAHSPSMAQMAAHIFNSAFLDSLEHDIEVMERMNGVVDMMNNSGTNPEETTGKTLRHVDILTIYPSIEFDEIAGKHIKDLPRPMRIAMKIIGATRKGGGASLASYLLFEKEFCKELIDYGYSDAMAQADKIRKFFHLDGHVLE